jgi:hypothetical protein
VLPAKAFTSIHEQPPSPSARTVTATGPSPTVADVKSPSTFAADATDIMEPELGFHTLHQPWADTPTVSQSGPLHSQVDLPTEILAAPAVGMPELDSRIEERENYWGMNMY